MEKSLHFWFIVHLGIDNDDVHMFEMLAASGCEDFLREILLVLGEKDFGFAFKKISKQRDEIKICMLYRCGGQRTLKIEEVLKDLQM